MKQEIGADSAQIEAASPVTCKLHASIGAGSQFGFSPPARASSLLKLSPVASFTGGVFYEILAQMAKFRDKFQACKAPKFRIKTLG